MMDLRTVVAYLVGLGIVYFLARAALVPLRYVAVIIRRTCLGAALLWLGNVAAQHYAVTGVAINPLTALIAGCLGVPGVVLLLVLGALIR